MNRKERTDSLILDVRTPAEYSEAHIPGAMNLPLFTDEERAVVGTLYKQQSREQAILAGFEFVGPRMSDMIRRTESLLKEHEKSDVLLYCARGGMRSTSVAWLLDFYGINTRIYPGGFKAYKSQLPVLCARLCHPILIEGPTGSGKTLILRALEQKGAQVIDLEGIAQHRGSAFGALPEASCQPSNEMITCLLIEKLSTFDPHRPVFIESESKKIGSREVPEALFEVMKQSPRIELDTPMEDRISLIVAQYGDRDPDYLLSAFEKIRRRLGSEACNRAKELVIAGELASAVRIALGYYDKAYTRSGAELWAERKIGKIPFLGDPDTAADNILKLLEHSL